MTALISPVSFKSFLSSWKFGIQAAPTDLTSNSMCASSQSQGKGASRRSSQLRRHENYFTEMDSSAVSWRDTDMQMDYDRASLPALHSSDSGSMATHTGQLAIAVVNSELSFCSLFCLILFRAQSLAQLNLWFIFISHNFSHFIIIPFLIFQLRELRRQIRISHVTLFIVYNLHPY